MPGSTELSSPKGNWALGEVAESGAGAGKALLSLGRHTGPDSQEVLEGAWSPVRRHPLAIFRTD